MEEINEKDNSNNNYPIGNTPDGFGKGINDYYNHYVRVEDAKARAILAANFILLGGLMNIDFC